MPNRVKVAASSTIAAELRERGMCRVTGNLKRVCADACAVRAGQSSFDSMLTCGLALRLYLERVLHASGESEMRPAKPSTLSFISGLAGIAMRRPTLPLERPSHIELGPPELARCRLS